MNRTLIRMIQESAKQRGNHPYAYRKIGMKWVPTSYAQMEKNARYLASFLLSKGLEKNARIALLAEGSPEWVCSEFGCLYAHMIAVPLSIKLTTEEVAARLEHSQVSMIALSEFTANKYFDSVDKTHHITPILWLDNDRDIAMKVAQERGVPLDNITLIGQALEEGQKLYETQGFDKKIDAILASITEDDCATITYSSGTTGNPKGVMLSHKNYYVNTQASVDLFGIKYGKTKTLLILPCDHAFGHTVGIYTTLCSGGELYFVDAQGGPTKMIHNIPINLLEVKPSYILVVPALANSLMKKVLSNMEDKGPAIKKMFYKAVDARIRMIGDGFEKVPFLTKLKNFWPWFFFGKLLIFPKVKKALPFKFAVSGGAFCDKKIQEFFAAVGIPLRQGYGMSEASPVISSNLLRKNTHKIGTTGRPFTGVECKVIRDNGAIAAASEIGEVCVRGETVMLGYFNNEKETGRTIVDGWLHTGDMGSLDSDGFLSIVGREKALLIHKDGEKFNPEEMEEAICTTSSNLVSQALLYCEHRLYVCGLLYLDDETLKKMVAELPSPVQLGSLNHVITNHIFAFKQDRSYLGHFPTLWMPTTYQLVGEPFPVNSTMKIVRYKAFEYYAKELEYLYSAQGSKPDHTQNINFLKAKLKAWNIPFI